jgi:hypothetical protein
VQVSDTRPPPADRDDKERERRLERVLPELIKRLLETGYEKISEGPENVRQFVHELKLPKEVLGPILAQIDETKHGLYRVVAKEVREFLEHTSVSEELYKVLTSVSFEIRTQVRFVPNESQSQRPKPDIRSKLSVRRASRDDIGDRNEEASADMREERRNERTSSVPPRRSTPPPDPPPEPPADRTNEDGEK